MASMVSTVMMYHLIMFLVSLGDRISWYILLFNYFDFLDMFFGSRSNSVVGQGSSASGMLKQMSHSPSVIEHRSQSNQSLQSLRSGPIDIGSPSSGSIKSPPSLSSTVLDSSSVGFVLNENAMKNLNQLASKLNDVNNGASGAITSTGSGPVFGRCASAMASMSSNTVTSVASVMAAAHQMVATGGPSTTYHGQLSRSPVPSLSMSSCSSTGVIGSLASLSSASTSSTVVSAGIIGNGPSHTTGNGKNHKVMQIRSKFGSLGSQTNQFSSPHGFCLGVNEEIVIADTNNHRICVYEKNGTFKQAFGNAGKDEGQLWYPRKVQF